MALHVSGLQLGAQHLPSEEDVRGAAEQNQHGGDHPDDVSSLRHMDRREVYTRWLASY